MLNESQNRAFLYGESIFTTLRMQNGTLCDWDYHFDRLKRGVEFVYGPFTDVDSWSDNLKNRFKIRALSESGDRVIRITVYREQSRGLVKTSLISSSDLKFHFSSTPFDLSRTEGRSVKLRTCGAIMRPHWWPSYLKAGSYLGVIIAQKVFLKSGDDDLLFLSPSDTVLESSVANIFIVRHNKLYTSPPGPNVLEGVMRRKVLEVAMDYFSGCEESETTLEQLMNADAVFGTNSVRGPFLIEAIDDIPINPSKEFLNLFDNLRRRVL